MDAGKITGIVVGGVSVVIIGTLLIMSTRKQKAPMSAEPMYAEPDLEYYESGGKRRRTHRKRKGRK